MDIHTESEYDVIELPPSIQSCRDIPIQWDQYLPFVPLETKLYASSPAATTETAVSDD